MYQKYILKICCGETDSRHYKMVLPGENFSNTWQEYKKKKKKKTIRISYLTLGNTYWENNSKEKKSICTEIFVATL